MTPCDCETCQSFRWDTGVSFDAWCAEGHTMDFVPPTQAPDGRMESSGWSRAGCEDYTRREGKPVAQSRPENAPASGGGQ